MEKGGQEGRFLGSGRVPVHRCKRSSQRERALPGLSLMSGDHATAHESGMATGTCTESCNSSVVQRESLKRLPQPHEQAKELLSSF